MLINGIKLTTIAANDRGLAYGDGLFSTVKVESGVLQLWDYHLQRLQLGAQRLFFPVIDWQLLTAEAQTLADSLVDQTNAIIKIVLTRGSGGRGYSGKECDAPTRILSIHAFPDFYKQWQREGIQIVLCQQRLATNPQLAGLKTLNRLEQVLIKHELESKGALEGIVCDNNGHVIEACSANIFICLDNHWLTPRLDGSGVAGVKRRQVMELAEQAGISITETIIRIDDLFNAQAVFLSNALMGIVPVRQLESYIYPSTCFALIDKLQSHLTRGEQ